MILGIFEMASKNVCTSTVLASPDLFTPTSGTSSAMETPKNTEEDVHDLELADEGDIQMEYSTF